MGRFPWHFFGYESGLDESEYEEVAVIGSMQCCVLSCTPTIQWPKETAAFSVFIDEMWADFLGISSSLYEHLDESVWTCLLLPV